MKAQRLRFRYRVAGAASSLSQRELGRAWETAVQAAGLMLAYSEGKRPAAQIAVAAPLPLDVTSDWELVDVFLSEWTDRAMALARLSASLPEGISPVAVEEVGVSAPSLQSQLRWAEYVVTIPAGGLTSESVQQAIDGLLGLDSLPAEYRRETRVRQYDLRPLVLDLWIERQGEGCLEVAMQLRAEPERTGRADQVVAALGLPEAQHIHRRRLYLEEAQAAVLAHRRAGEPEEG